MSFKIRRTESRADKLEKELNKLDYSDEAWDQLYAWVRDLDMGITRDELRQLSSYIVYNTERY